MPYREVVVATDFSGASSAAAALAEAVAAPGARFHVVHARPMAAPAVYGSPSPQETQRERERLARGLQEWAAKQRLPHADARLLDGSPSREIAREAERVRADLVAVGATGHGGLRERLLGSTARRVARAAPADVLVARAPTPAAGPRRILLATDFEPPSEEAARRAAALVAADGSALTLAHVVDVDAWRGAATGAEFADPVHLQAGREAAAKALAEFNRKHLAGRADETVRTGTPRDELAKLAAELGADLLVVGTHGGGLIERALLGSVAEGVVEAAPCSVLVVRAR